ncbi:putative triacylglycerol lipase [Medicago truncatula]|uniref:Putative triacylglycerol lipase n=1 Tax=Medicago truncatula TaxID=3880 RepID=A0A396J5U1_MEDTR|nr:putative triacylglycerol lipase [Medicago truncatula]
MPPIGTNIALGLQIENHKTIVAQIANELGGFQQAAQYLNKCLYYVYIGTNNYSLNYFQPELYNTSGTYNPEEYAQVLIDELSIYLHVALQTSVRANSANNGSCVEELNDVEAIFSEKLKSLVDQSNTLYVDSKSIFINTTAIRIDGSLGFRVFASSCCPIKSDGFCIRDSIPCTNRNEYIFYDGMHPTLAANNIIASLVYDSTSNPEVTYPTDIKRLAQLVI